MEKLINFLTNIWFKRGVSIISCFYLLFIGFAAWLSMAYYMEPQHEGSLFTLYIFINLLFGGIMFFTRKLLLTQITAMLAPVLAFAILIFAFGNWFFIIPPIIVSIFIFFMCGAGETIKTILGTIYLIMYVVGVLVYLTLKMLFGNISLAEVNLSERSRDYNISPDGKYRIVQYVEDASDDRRSIKFYVEKTDGDIELPFVTFRKVLGGKHLITSRYESAAVITWKEPAKIYIDGKFREDPFTKTDADTDSEE